MADVSKRAQHPSMVQGNLFGELSLQTQVIKQRKDFEALFEGFNKMQAISYVASPDLLVVGQFENDGT